MKKLFLPFALLMIFSVEGWSQVQYQYKIITSVESIVPMGLGRSRLIENKQEVDVSKLTTERFEGTDSDQRGVKRKDVKIDELSETKMLNFYSAVGINFQNVASNDAVVSSRINELAAEGWELAFVTSGVESDAGKSDGVGIFITRYIFKRPIQ